MAESGFERAVKPLLEKYKRTALTKRWDEATSFGAGSSADAYFINEAEDAINVVWLNTDGIRDITVLLEAGTQSMFNFLLLKNVESFEVREGPSIAERIGLDVQGDYLVRVMTADPTGTLYWVAGTRAEIGRLRKFLDAVLTAFVSAR